MLSDALIETFQAAANPEMAVSQADYMRNQFPFLGLTAPARRALQGPLFKQYPLINEAELQKTAQIWWQFDEREFQYAALDLVQKYRRYLSDLDFVRCLIETKSWWDTVDALASNVVGTMVKNNPSLHKTMDTWIQDSNMWMRRVALLHQLRWKSDTNAQRLFDYCLQTAYEKEFFIQKAIGWALRTYGKESPQAVRDFIETHRYRFSALSVREAMK